jgi:hypothetical protein
MSLLNSRSTRVQPIFRWLEANGGQNWPTELINLATDLKYIPDCGPVCRVNLDPEYSVEPTAARLAWMIKNSDQLTPQNGKYWREIKRRIENSNSVGSTLAKLDRGQQHGIQKSLIFEGKTHADCLIECERTYIWIEGKRTDWLSPSTKWDITRDQLARNLEAVWSLASECNKEYYLIICYETTLKYHETLLLNGYRQRTWVGGWPHLSAKQRNEFSKRIGTLKWATIATQWPQIKDLPLCADIE